MKKNIVIIILFFNVINGFSQRYWVFFKDKKNTDFDPYSYFDPKAIDRRLKNGISLFDSTDFPVNEFYLSEVSKIVDSINYITRWFNGVSVLANEEQINKVLLLQFVKNITPINLEMNICSQKYDTTVYENDVFLINKQIDFFEGKLFMLNNITGKGVRIAIFDAGFPGVDSIPVFEHIRKNNRIIKTYDFAKKKENVYKYNEHGTMVLSCIAGKINDHNLGLATESEFLLARTEIEREVYSEEENWLAAVEWADKNGADIINSSLGYTLPRYYQYQMDGEFTLVSKAAKMASDKGILVVNAMGNDGDGSWKFVAAPADVEEVLSVGGVDPYTDYQIYFSSFGPTSDKRMKPNVCASGEAFVASKKMLTSASGTSFASPLVCGFAACVLQLNPNLTNLELKEKIEQSGHLYPYFDYAHGFGVPQATYFFEHIDNIDTCYNVQVFDDKIIITFNTVYDKNILSNNLFYYHFSYNEKELSEYVLIELTSENNAIEINLENIERPQFFMSYYRNYIYKIKID
jgi:subtilisin family serine protease